jgi:hypothetical protein
MSFLVNFDTPIDPQSRRFAATLTPLAYKHLTQLQERGYSVTLITRLFRNLAAARLHELDDIPLFEHPIGDPTERWNQQKGRLTKPFAQVATDKTRVLHSHLQVDHASKAELQQLRLLIRLFLEQLLAPFVLVHTMLDGSPVKTATHRGSLPKYTLPVTRAYFDGSATKNESCARFWSSLSRATRDRPSTQYSISHSRTPNYCSCGGTRHPCGFTCEVPSTLLQS